MSNPNQLHLLADHIKLSLLEQQRARSLHLDDQSENDVQVGHITRSLAQFRDGLDALDAERKKLEQDGEEAALPSLNDSYDTLQRQYQDLLSGFRGNTSASTLETLNSPNDQALAADFAHANSIPAHGAPKSKAVRFNDSPTPATRANNAVDAGNELFGPYRDDPSPGYRDEQIELTNQQIHEHHSQILEEQDHHLDRLGESISRQRELSMQIGDELDDHVAMLDDMEAATDRQQSRLDRASRALGKVAKSARENRQMTAIFVLIIILVLLIAILK